jgi:hypothetical protein
MKDHPFGRLQKKDARECSVGVAAKKNRLLQLCHRHGEHFNGTGRRATDYLSLSQ